jgi:phospholipase/carboxylesterase
MQHAKHLVEAGRPLEKASRALIMLHGRGATAEDIISLHSEFPVEDYYIVAPQATNYTWYPYSFLAPAAQNEPWLSSALNLLRGIVHDIEGAGISSDKIFILGFSQGACLTLEFATRNATRWGGIIAFTGGLIGDALNKSVYSGRFDGTPVLIGNSDADPHVPLGRSQESALIMEQLGADVNLKIFPGMQHTINREEIRMAGEMLK